jgi:hypothetical protein
VLAGRARAGRNQLIRVSVCRIDGLASHFYFASVVMETAYSADGGEVVMM